MINIQALTFHRENPIECGFKMCARTRCLIEFFTGRLPNATLFAFPLPCLLPRKKPTLWLPFISFLWMSSRLSICHSSRHFRPQNLLQLFQTTPPLPLPDPWFCTSSFKTTITLSFTVRSRMNAAWLCHCQLFAKLSGWCEAAVRASSGPRVVLAQVKAYPGLKLSLKRTKRNNNIKLKSKTQAKERTKMEFQNLFFSLPYLSIQMLARSLRYTHL